MFVNQFPMNYRINFLMQIWNNDVKTVKANFPLQAKVEKYKLRSLVIFMREFMENMDFTDSNQIPVNDYLLVTNRDLFIAIDTISRILLERALPLCNQLATLEGLDAFFAAKPGWAVNSLNFNNISTELTVARLNGRRDFQAVYQQIMEDIDQKIISKEMGTDTKALVAHFYHYLISQV